MISSVQDDRLVGGDHVFDVDEGILPAVSFHQLQSFLDKVTNVFSLVLSVLDLVAQVDWKNEELINRLIIIIGQAID